MNRHLELKIDIPATIANRMAYVQSMVDAQAKRYIEYGRINGETLREAVDQAAVDLFGIDHPSEIKRLFRAAVRKLEK